MSGFGPDTIVWNDHVVTHDLSAFPELERTERRGRPLRAYRNRPETLHELLSSVVDEHPDRGFLVFPDSDSAYTYEEIRRRTRGVAAGMVAEGVSTGDRIGLICDSRPEFVEVVLAAARLGAVPMPLNTRHSPRELGNVLADAAPDVLVTTASHAEKLDRSPFQPPEERTFVVGDAGIGRPFERLVGTPPVNGAPPTASDRCAIMHTSGTTGQPKAVPIDNFQCVNAVLNNVYSHGLDDGITNLVLTPLFHVTGLVCGLLTTIAVGGTAVIPSEYSPERFARLIDDHAVDYCMGVPTHIVLSAEKVDTENYDLSSLEKFAYGGAPMPPGALPKIRDAFPDTRLYHSYGKTENFAGIAAMIPDPHIEDRPESVGLPTLATKFAVVDEEFNRLPPGELGELAMYGPFVAEGYLNPSDSDDEFDSGWHYTGDIGVIDEDGFIELKGRKGDMIIRGGENVYPVEVEDVLRENEAVLETAVTSFPDDVLGERILAVVVPNEGEYLTEDALRRTCEGTLADYKVPEIFRIVEELPRNANGKIQRDDLVPEPLQFGIGSGD